MNRVQKIISSYTDALPLMERVYSEELPYPEKIAKEIGVEVSELFEEISRISNERERLDNEGEVNCDVLDDCWMAMTRLASVIPYQARLLPKQVLTGLYNENNSVRFYIAYSLQKVPFKAALPYLQDALKSETDQLNIKVIRSAIERCSSFSACLIAKINKYKNKRVENPHA